MNLTPKQLEMQNAILLAVHKTDDIEEARKIESVITGCVYDLEGKYATYIGTVVPNEYTYNILFLVSKHIKCYDADYDYDIIGLPPTLARVLVALGDYIDCLFKDGMILERIEDENRGRQEELVCDRKLLNDDGTPCNLFDQSSETQQALYPLLVK